MGNYPQFISNLPCGEDHTKGKSQEHLAVAIAEHILSTDSKDENQLSRIIGLKGEWGTGKSNVIKILDKPNEELQKARNVLKQIKDGYHIFEYDAWGHQEDLQRRSFLETLTKDLISEEILYGETTIETKKEDLKTVTWEEKLKYLLATKREFETETKPKLNDCFVLAVLVAIFTPICAIIANVDCISQIWWLSIVITIFPLLIASIALLIIKCKHKWSIKTVFQEIVSIYSGKIQNDVSSEIVSEDEPSVSDFKKWMEDISNHLNTSNKKLIVVYDNMDRLPADKVKELWSSIHTFFAENGFKNIWVIIPFDEKHLSCAFGESDEKEQLTKHFISKTFPVVYRVTPPVITDYQKLFNNLYSQAFGETEEKNRENIYRILRLEKPNATIREMIEFINSLVALKQIWKEDIDLLYCAVFKLKENDIINHPIVEYISVEQDGETHISTKDATIEEEILSGYYLGDYIKNIIPNDETLQTNISALVYGVSKNLAEQIPMIKYINSCFEDNSNDINKYSQSSEFIDILQKNIQDADKAKTDNIIKSLSKLNVESLSASDKTKISILWDELTKRKEDQKLSQQEFDDSYQSLLLYVNDKENLLARLCERLQSFGKEENVAFSGANYYNALKSIQDFISGNNIGIDITHYLTEIEKDPKTFVDYVQAAKDDYKLFKLSTDNSKLNDYFFNGDKNIEDLSILAYIKDDSRYTFDRLKEKIEKFIPTNELTIANFKKTFDAYKSISDDKPLKVQLTPSQRNQFWINFSSKVGSDEYLEIAAIQLANCIDIGGELSDEQTAYIAEQMDYYENYGSLLINSNNPNLYKVLKYMTENKLGYALSLDKVLPKFFEIKNKIGVTEETLLNQLNDWKEYKDDITKENIQKIVHENLYQFTTETNNDLTKHINKTAAQALSDIDDNTLYNLLGQQNNYWYKVVSNLMDTEFCKSLPNNVFNIGIRYLNEVATTGTTPQINSIKARIINKLDKRKTGAVIEDIRNKFCNSQSTITVQSFLYLESWLRKQGELKQRATEVIHKIIDPIINNSDCLSLLADNSEFYAEIFSKAGDDATSTRLKIQKIINEGNVGNSVIEFGRKIMTTKDDKTHPNE